MAPFARVSGFAACSARAVALVVVTSEGGDDCRECKGHNQNRSDCKHGHIDLFPGLAYGRTVRGLERRQRPALRFEPQLREKSGNFKSVRRQSGRLFDLAGGLGFEPRLTESESAVLPLNYPPMRRAYSISSLAASCGGHGRIWSPADLGHLWRLSKPQSPPTPAAIAAGKAPTACAGRTSRTRRWRRRPTCRRRRKGTPRADARGRGTARRSTAPRCRRCASRW